MSFAGDEVAQAGEPPAGFEVVARAGEDAGGPVVEVVDVGDQAGEMPHYRPFGRLQGARFLGLQVVVVQDEEAEDREQLYEQEQRIHAWAHGERRWIDWRSGRGATRLFVVSDEL